MVKAGDILIAEPYLGDENFERSVVLVGSHDAQGAFGFILNKKSTLVLSDVVEDLESFDTALYVGGPVEQDTLHFIYRNESSLQGSVQIKDNLFWGGDFEQLKMMLRNDMIRKEDIRFFLGYSGWSEGQLDQEMNAKAWISYEIAIAEIFETQPEDMWRHVLKSMGGKYKLLANYPIDPRLN